MKESRRRINNLGFFEEVNVATSKGVDEAHMNVDVDVKERAAGTFSVGFGYSSVDGFVGQGSVTQENFLGRALKLNLAGSLGVITSYSIHYTKLYEGFCGQRIQSENAGEAASSPAGGSGHPEGARR